MLHALRAYVRIKSTTGYGLGFSQPVGTVYAAWHDLCMRAICATDYVTNTSEDGMILLSPYRMREAAQSNRSVSAMPPDYAMLRFRTCSGWHDGYTTLG